MARKIVRINPAADTSIPSIANYKIALNKAAEALKCHSDVLSQLGAIFLAIKKGAGRIDELAGAGHYLADDFANLADCQAEEFRNEVNAPSVTP